MTIIILKDLNELKTVLTLIDVLMSTNTQVKNEQKDEKKNSNAQTSGKKRGRPRKVSVEETVDFKRFMDEQITNERRKSAGLRKKRTIPTFRTTFYNTKEDAMNACLIAGLPYTRIMKIRPTQANVGYPQYFYLKCATRTLQEITTAARHQYIEMWNARHNFRIPSPISVSISSKQVFKKKKAK